MRIFSPASRRLLTSLGSISIAGTLPSGELSIAGAQRLQRLRHAAHGNQFRARDMGLLMLERFAHVHHANLFACIEAPLDFTWIDLYCRHVALRRPYISRLTPRRNRDLGASH